jgi:hypothetical protein
MGTYVSHAGEGALGGLAGTIFVQAMKKLDPKLPEPLRAPEMKGDPFELVLSSAEKKLGARLPEDAHGRTVGGLPWAYGAGWGAGLGLVSPLLGVRSFGKAAFAGAVMGAACWTAGFVGWMPAAGLVEPIQRQGLSHASASLGGHVVFGVISGLVMHAIDRILAPRAFYELIFPRKWSLFGLATELLG